MLGYVIDEHDGRWVKHCLNNRTVRIPCLKYSNAKQIESNREVYGYDVYGNDFFQLLFLFVIFEENFEKNVLWRNDRVILEALCSLHIIIG